MSSVVNCDLVTRNLMVEIIKKQNEELIKYLCKRLNLDEEKFLEKYLTPYYYMPIIEKRSIIL